MNLSDSRLEEMAFAALEDVAAVCLQRPGDRSRALALVLAYLASRANGPRWPYDRYWQSIIGPRDVERCQSVNASLNAIYLAAGRKRTLDTMSAI